MPGARGREDFLNALGFAGLGFFTSLGSIGLRLAKEAALFVVGTGVIFASTFLAKSDLKALGVINSLTSCTESSKASSSVSASVNTNS